MSRMFICTIIALMAISGGLYAQEMEKVQGKSLSVEQQTEEITPVRYSVQKDEAFSNGVKLELVYSIDQNQFPTGNKMLQEIMQALKSKNIPQEDIDWVLNKIRLDILRKTQILYTKEGKEIKMPYFAHLPHSSNYKYFILNTCDYKDRTARNQLTKLIRTSDGSVLWEIIDKMMLDAFISNDGNVTIDATPASPPVVRNLKNVRFYNQKGNLIKTAGDLLGFPMWADMTDIGNLFVVMSGKDGVHLVGFDHQGNELWRIPVPGGVERISFFNNDKYAVYTYSCDGAHTLLIDENGSIVGNYDFIIRNGTFTSDGKYLISSVNQDSVHYISTKNGEAYCDKIGNGLSTNCEYYFVNIFDESNKKGVIAIDNSGAIQGTYVEEGVVSPNKYIIITSEGVQFVEVENEK